MMNQEYIKEANRLKQEAGQRLDDQIFLKFNELKEQGVIKNFYGKSNFSHTGHSYPNQYKTNFIIKTLDDKYIIINSSNSYRQDRVKQDLYDFQGIMHHADIADSIIASILLYPDIELNNTALISYRRMVKDKVAHSDATHIFVFSELVQFLENHRMSVEQQFADEIDETGVVKDGSYYGLRGNAFEKEVVGILSDYEYLNQLKNNSCSNPIYIMVMNKIFSDSKVLINDVISVTATNTVLKLKNGGNAKTDIVITIKTVFSVIVETVSVKNTTKNRVSCHDYRASDFIRVLDIENKKLANYFLYYQQFGSDKRFVEGLPRDYSVEEFVQLLKPVQKKLVEWALTGSHDSENLIDSKIQTSKYLLINKSNSLKFVDFKSYIVQIYQDSKLVYGIPLSWTYPSKQRGSRIQFKLPII